MSTPQTDDTPALSPSQVQEMSDDDLAEAVARTCLGERVETDRYSLEDWRFARWRTGLWVWWKHPNFSDIQRFSPSNPVAVEHVTEYMRAEWRRQGEKHGVMWFWSAQSTQSDVRPWIISVMERGPSPHANARVCKSSGIRGRAVFECALLAAQEMEK